MLYSYDHFVVYGVIVGDGFVTIASTCNIELDLEFSYPLTKS